MTLAQQRGITDFPYTIRNENNDLIYVETYSGTWIKREFDSRGNEIYVDNSEGFFYRKEYDDQGREIYYENSRGRIVDNRPRKLNHEVIQVIL
jgi:hypothetical protein